VADVVDGAGASIFAQRSVGQGDVDALVAHWIAGVRGAGVIVVAARRACTSVNGGCIDIRRVDGCIGARSVGAFVAARIAEQPHRETPCDADSCVQKTDSVRVHVVPVLRGLEHQRAVFLRELPELHLLGVRYEWVTEFRQMDPSLWVGMDGFSTGTECYNKHKM
jgi:hypothetical protein